MTDPLFQPIRIGRMELANRMVMPAMHLNMAGNYAVNDAILAFYAPRARGGVAMITAGYATVDERSGHGGNIGAHKDVHIPGLARLAEVIHEGGAKASIQLNHAGRYNPSILMGGKEAVAPSALASRLTGETPHALGLDELREIVKRFGEAAGRVKAAGFDSVEILMGTGYLISEFLSPLTNKREDEYGGTLENRARFGLEVLRAVRAEVGAEFPLVVRINGNDLMRGGAGAADQREFARLLAAEGADAFCVNVGWHEAQVPQIVGEVPRGAFAWLARSVKEVVDVPVIASHRINDPATARDLVTDGWCDLVALGRALIADPNFPEKARMGREKDILHCVACAQGCFDNLFKMKSVECLCNPLAGHETERAIEAAAKALRVAVAGGGAAGMSAALAASRRGHRVTLYEEGPRLGGQLFLAGAAPGREEFAQLALDLSRQLELAGVEVRLGATVDAGLLESERPDALVIATGGRPALPAIPGIDSPKVAQAWDILSGKIRAGRKVAIIGGGAVGVETALFLAEKGTLSAEALKFLLVHGAESQEELVRLASRGGREIVLVEMLSDLGANFGKTTRWTMLQDLRRAGVRAITKARVEAVTEAGLRVEVDGRVEDIDCDSIVLAVGTKSRNELETIAAAMGIPTAVAGDAKKPDTAFESMQAGFLAGLGL